MQQLDIRAIYKLLLSKWYVLVALAVVGAAVLSCFTVLFMPVEYTTGVSMYVSSLTNTTQSQTGGMSYGDLVSAEWLVLTYVDILEDYSTLAKIQPMLSRNVTIQDLKNMISMSGVENTAILYISVTADDANFAAEVCNAMARVAPEVFASYKIGGSVKAIGEALPGYRVSTGLTRMAVIGGIVGALAAALYMVLRYLTDNTVKTPAMLKQRVKVPVLGVIPGFEKEMQAKGGR